MECCSQVLLLFVLSSLVRCASGGHGQVLSVLLLRSPRQTVDLFASIDKPAFMITLTRLGRLVHFSIAKLRPCPTEIHREIVIQWILLLATKRSKDDRMRRSMTVKITLIKFLVFEWLQDLTIEYQVDDGFR